MYLFNSLVCYISNNNTILRDIVLGSATCRRESLLRRGFCEALFAKSYLPSATREVMLLSLSS